MLVKNVKFFRSFLVLFLIAGSCAFSRTFSQHGMIDIPTADILPHREAEACLAILLYESEIQTHSKGAQDITLGLFDWINIGFIFESEYEFAGHLRLRLLKDISGLPDLSIGIQNLTGKENISEYGADFKETGKQNNSFYGVLSKRFTLFSDLPVTFHLGAGNGRFSGENNKSENFHGIFFGFESWLTRFIRIMVEEDGRDVNVGATVAITDYLQFHFAVTELEMMFNPDTDLKAVDPKQHTKVAFGMTYKIDFFRSKLSKKEELIKTLKVEKDRNRVLQNELEDLKSRREQTQQDIEELKNKLKDSNEGDKK